MPFIKTQKLVFLASSLECVFVKKRLYIVKLDNRNLQRKASYNMIVIYLRTQSTQIDLLCYSHLHQLATTPNREAYTLNFIKHDLTSKVEVHTPWCDHCTRSVPSVPLIERAAHECARSSLLNFGRPKWVMANAEAKRHVRGDVSCHGLSLNVLYHRRCICIYFPFFPCLSLRFSFEVIERFVRASSLSTSSSGKSYLKDFCEHQKLLIVSMSAQFLNPFRKWRHSYITCRSSLLCKRQWLDFSSR